MKIYIAIHKKSNLPEDLDLKLYMPLQVNAAKNAHFLEMTDDTGDNISIKNPCYNELTATYWIWKNSEEDIKGLCHYRRFFVKPSGKIKNLFFKSKTDFLSEDCIIQYLKNYDIIIHNKTFFKETIRGQFEKTQNCLDLLITRQILQDDFPDYVKSFDKVMDGCFVHLLNMLIARKDVFDLYAEWLFSVLFKVEQILKDQYKIEGMNRRMGMLAERLLDVWILKNNIKYKESFTINTEKRW